MPKARRKRQLWIYGVLVVLTGAVVFTLGSLNVPLHSGQGITSAILVSLSLIIGCAFVIFVLILFRSLVRLGTERRSGQMGSRFKVKMVAGAMGISLLPVFFMFLFSYALVNRTLNAWFPRPLEEANKQSQVLLDDLEKAEFVRLSDIASQSAHDAPDQIAAAASRGSHAFWIADSHGKVTSGTDFTQMAGGGRSAPSNYSFAPTLAQTIASGAQVWRAGGQLYLAGHASMKDGTLYVARRLPSDFLERYADIKTQNDTYAQQHQDLRAYKNNILRALMLMTVVLLFTTTWVALFLSKQVTVPIQGLVEATREISRGNFNHRIQVQAQDELGTLVRSFNRMTEQLGAGREQINEFTRNLEQAVEERERRRKLMETILENIPTGVISLTSAGEVARVNTAVVAILGDYAREARTLTELLGEEASRSVLHLMRRSLRMGVASREIEIASSGRLVRTAVTVSSLGPRRSNPGFIVVIDDLTDLLRAQKAAAWQEVAQRIAHEIKNPLTPIQLSAQRLLRYIDKTSATHPRIPRTDFEKLAAECAGLIQQEVQTLKALVDEFSQFARFPSARLAPTDLNSIVEKAIELFSGRLDGVAVQISLAEALPPVKADPELLRRVVANLIDNAAESMEGSTIRHLWVITRPESDGDAVEIEISDSGHGISPEDKERLFLPHFSTKERGTGLGLAIASRIISEHNGTIRVEDNFPAGTRFLIRFPAAEISTVPAHADTQET